MKHQRGEFDLCINSQSRRGNFDIRHLESLRGFDTKRPGNKYGGEARSSFIEKGILYTMSQFLPSLNQYRLYVRIGKHTSALLSLL
jgi:hypothetical protein